MVYIYITYIYISNLLGSIAKLYEHLTINFWREPHILAVDNQHSRPDSTYKNKKPLPSVLNTTLNFFHQRFYLQS